MDADRQIGPSGAPCPPFITISKFGLILAPFGRVDDSSQRADGVEARNLARAEVARTSFSPINSGVEAEGTLVEIIWIIEVLTKSRIPSVFSSRRRTLTASSCVREEHDRWFSRGLIVLGPAKLNHPLKKEANFRRRRTPSSG